jgi:hypothetical protein
MTLVHPCPKQALPMKTPVTIYIVHHPQCNQAERLATQLFKWFRLTSFSAEASAAGLPVYFRRHVADGALHPPIRFEDAERNVVILLVDHGMVVDAAFRRAVVELANEIDRRKKIKAGPGRAILLPGAMHESFYRIGPLYEHFNPVRLLKLPEERMEATIRRAATEAIARELRVTDDPYPPPLNVFLSHAKRDGTPIAEAIRDGVRSFSQLVAWYDANDLPIGSEWTSRMERAAGKDTAAMVVTVTDAYPTRPWCRREAKLARTPVQAVENDVETPSKDCRVWKVQPVVAVHRPGSAWVRGVPMLDGVPRIGWDGRSPDDQIEQIVDRLVLEILLGYVHCRAALDIDSRVRRTDSCYITWVPDVWTLATLRHEMQNVGIEPCSVRRIVYPGYGLRKAEIAELDPVLTTFCADTDLVSFEEALE